MDPRSEDEVDGVVPHLGQMRSPRIPGYQILVYCSPCTGMVTGIALYIRDNGMNAISVNRVMSRLGRARDVVGKGEILTSWVLGLFDIWSESYSNPLYP